MAQRDLLVRIIGDNKSLLRAFTSSSRGAKQFDRDMGRVTRGALAGSGALGGLGKSLAFASGGFLSGAAAVGLVVRAFQELNESRRVTAQTNAVIRSTGRVAGVTAQHVEELGNALLRQTGIDDEAIRSAENLLLTFTNVRNVIGDGNDVFDQATKVILDMSVAMGEDLSSATIRVGKALQDPIRGVTALRRVGVLLTESQEAQIKALVQTGRVMDAQRIVLRELTREFGGSAAAAGNVQPWNLLRETIINLSAVLAEKFLPKIQEVSARLQTWLDNPGNVAKLEEDASRVANAFGSVVDSLVDLNNRGNAAMEKLRTGVTASAAATRVGLLKPFERLGGPIGEWAERERKEALAKLEALRRGAVAVAVDMRTELEEALQLKNRTRRVPEVLAEPPTIAPAPEKLKPTKRIFDDLVKGSRAMKDAAEDAKLEAEAAADAFQEAQRRLVEARNARQFFALGLSPTGGERTPLISGLRRQLGNFEDAVKGSFLDTKKTRSVLSAIRKILAGGMGKVSEDVRATIRDMLRDLNQQLKGQDAKAASQTLAKVLDVSDALKGLKGTPEALARARNLLTGATVVPRQLASVATIGGAGATDLHVHLELDGRQITEVVVRDFQRTAKRTSVGRR